MMNICLFGASSAFTEPVYLEAVEHLGEMMARRGHTLVYGGGATGLMGAAARGMARIPGRRIIGIAPKFFDREGILYPQCSEMIFTDNMGERKARMEELADAFVVVPGGVGTYEEFFEVLTLKQLGQMDKPITVFNIHGYFNELENLLKHTVEQYFAEESIHSLYTLYDSAEELLRDLENV